MSLLAGPLAAILATLASLLSAAALYAGSPHCRWISWRRQRAAGTALGLLLAVLALALWIAALGVGAGLCVMLAAWMSAAIALPYLAARTGTAAGNGGDGH